MAGTPSLENQKFIEFHRTWSLDMSDPFNDYELNRSVYSPSFKTVHNNIGFEWKFQVCPRRTTPTENNGAENREHIGLYLWYAGGLHQSLEGVDSLFFVENVSLRQTNGSSWLGAHNYERGKGWGLAKFLPLDMGQLQSRGLIKNDAIQLAMKIKIPEELFSWKKIWEKKKELEQSWDGKDFSAIVGDIVTTDSEERPASDVAHVLDLKIKTNDRRVIWCHKVALQKNERFMYLMSRDFREAARRGVREAAGCQVDCAYDSNTMKEILHFIYTDKVSEDFLDRDVEEICRAARCYELDGLKLECEGRMIEGLGVENARKMLDLADSFPLEILKEMSLNLVSENPTGLRWEDLDWPQDEEIQETWGSRARVLKVPPPIIP